MVGDQRATLALSHFTAARVVVVVHSRTLRSRNGWIATAITLNMLSRFVGRIALYVEGESDETLDRRLAEHLLRLQQIDTRPGRVLERAYALPLTDTAVVLTVGETDEQYTDGPNIETSTGQIIALGFTAWTCEMLRGRTSGLQRSIASSVPFGAMAGACFAVAEVFKTLIASCLEEQPRNEFRKRYVATWRYNVWTQERTPDGDDNMSTQQGPNVLPALVLDRRTLVQVGAGAVGNATAYAFSETDAISGALRTLDVKHVDEKNLNRCLYFREQHVGESKVSVLASEAGSTGLLVEGVNERYRDEDGHDCFIVLSTVDNNEVRHQMQESLPAYVVEGSTGETQVSVSVHNAVNGRTCLVCKHPDRQLGVERRRPLTVAEMAARTGISEEAVVRGIANGTHEISNALIQLVRRKNPEMAACLVEARGQGLDLCGALGDLRNRFGMQEGPRDASVPFVSVLAGVLAAAEVTKLVMRRTGMGDVPVLDNVAEFDLGRDYSRRERIAGDWPATANCEFCQRRGDDVRAVYHWKHSTITAHLT
jgi:hypothetical protein